MKFYSDFNSMFNAQSNKQDMSVFNVIHGKIKPHRGVNSDELLSETYSSNRSDNVLYLVIEPTLKFNVKTWPNYCKELLPPQTEEEAEMRKWKGYGYGEKIPADMPQRPKKFVCGMRLVDWNIVEDNPGHPYTRAQLELLDAKGNPVKSFTNTFPVPKNPNGKKTFSNLMYYSSINDLAEIVFMGMNGTELMDQYTRLEEDVDKIAEIAKETTDDNDEWKIAEWRKERGMMW